MSQMIFVLTFLAIFGALTIVVDRYIQSRKELYLANNSQAQEAANQPVAPAVSTPADRTQQFRTWAIQAFAHRPEMQNWLSSLSDAGLDGLILEVASFTNKVGVSFDWLMAEDLSHHPATQRQLTDMLWHYCQAWHEASAAHTVVKALQAWRAFERDPAAKSQQPLLQALATQLTAQKLMPPVPPEILVAPEQQRQAYTIQLIRDVAQREPARFYQVLPEAVAVAQATNQTTFGAFAETIQQAFASRFAQKNSATPAAGATEATGNPA